MRTSALKVTHSRARPQAALAMLCLLLLSAVTTQQRCSFLGKGLKCGAIRWPEWPRPPAFHVPMEKTERNYLRASNKQ